MDVSKPFDVAVIGGGIVGLASARALAQTPGRRIVVLEAEADIARHQTGHNSGVIHSGLYYRPGSLKAANCAAGRDAMYRYCEEKGIRHERCGKIVVAVNEAQRPALDELERRGRANGLEGLRRLGPEAIRELEPHARGVDGLHVPQTGIVDFSDVAHAYARDLADLGMEVRTGFRVAAVRKTPDGWILSDGSAEVPARALVNCAGLHSDRIARLCGMEPEVRIVPFRGEYYRIKPGRESLVRNLIYPVPDPRFPFLGVHFTRMVHGGVEAGPNAVLALKREGYRKLDFSLRDVGSWFFYGGFWKLAFRYWRMGLGELWRSFSKGAFVRSMQALVPEIEKGGVRRAGSGVRAQALEPSGALVDDFRIVEAERQLHVLNAPSPAATASIAIGRTLAAMAQKSFGLASRK